MIMMTITIDDTIMVWNIRIMLTTMIEAMGMWMWWDGMRCDVMWCDGDVKHQNHAYDYDRGMITVDHDLVWIRD